MTGSQERATTGASSTRMKREDWLNSRNQKRTLWIAQHQKIGELLLTGSVRHGRDWFITWTCSCGKNGESRWSDLKLRVNNPSAACKSCIMKKRMEYITEEQHKKLEDMSILAVEKIRKPAEWSTIRKICQQAKRRCNNKNCPGYKNYGGRGIKFMFDSGSQMAQWILDNLGPRPSNNHSIDRIDNNAHYEKGNLRWATREEQNSNKRAYKIGANGMRIRKLLGKTSYGYESIRTFIKRGMTDDEIVARNKKNCGRKRTKITTSVRLG